MIRHRSLAVLLAAAALAACDKNGVQELTVSAPSANVKFFNLGVGTPGVNFYANSTKITAINSTACQPPADTTQACLTTGKESTTGTTFGNGGNGGLYSSVTAGQTTLSGKIAAATDKDLAISNVSTTLEAGKFYTFIQSGFYNTTAKTVEAFLLQDDIPTMKDPTLTYVRFVNAIPNSGPLVLYIKDPASGVEDTGSPPTAYKTATEFGVGPAGPYDLIVRNAGSTAIRFTVTGVGFAPVHAYTVIAYGDNTVTSTTAATRPQLSISLNR